MTFNLLYGFLTALKRKMTSVINENNFQQATLSTWYLLLRLITDLEVTSFILMMTFWEEALHRIKFSCADVTDSHWPDLMPSAGVYN